MDNKTRAMLEDLKQYLDEVEINHQGWENTSRIFMLAYSKLVELSTYLAPEMSADRLTNAHLEIQQHSEVYPKSLKRQRIKTKIK